MEVYYFEIRAVHIAAALASGGFYLVRALALNLLAASWPLSIVARLASYSIDTVLFTAALMLTAVTRQYPFVDAWLTMKVVVMLPLYIFLGYWALRAKAFKLRLAAMAGAIAAFLFIYSIARTHNPLGVIALG
jgi:uncharacterized membrane protein SirB2